MNYLDIYEKLYRLGYHAMLKNHGERYVDYICQNYRFNRIIDVGCSNGMAVKKFMKQRKMSYGLDAAHIAVRYAAEQACIPNCIQGTATDIPFRDKYFDAVFSCDMLEHLERKDVGMAISEMVRVCTRYLFIVLDCCIERNRDWIEKAKIHFPQEFSKIENLHLTVMEFGKWRKLFEHNGARFIKEEAGLYVFSVGK